MCRQEGRVFRPQHVLNQGPGDQQVLGAGPVPFAAEQPIRILLEAGGLGGIKYLFDLLAEIIVRLLLG